MQPVWNYRRSVDMIKFMKKSVWILMTLVLLIGVVFLIKSSAVMVVAPGGQVGSGGPQVAGSSSQATGGLLQEPEAPLPTTTPAAYLTSPNDAPPQPQLANPPSVI